MADIDSDSVLRRLARPLPPAPPPVTPARALRMALTRAAERSAGLGLTVLGVTEEMAALDVVLQQVPDGMMLLGLVGDAGLAGFVGVDLEMRTAMVEVQTMGRLRKTPAEARPVTATDAALSQPLIAAFLLELGPGTKATPLEGWIDGFRVEGRLAGIRAAEMALEDTLYRLVRLTVDLAAGERQGEIALALPVSRVRSEVKPNIPGMAFAARLRSNVMLAEAALDAVLAQLRLPLRQAEGLEVGQILPLSGVTVASVRLQGPDGQVIARGRLGQASGMRAIRLEDAAAPELAAATLSGTARPRPGEGEPTLASGSDRAKPTQLAASRSAAGLLLR